MTKDQDKFYRISFWVALFSSLLDNQGKKDNRENWMIQSKEQQILISKWLQTVREEISSGN